MEKYKRLTNIIPHRINEIHRFFSLLLSIIVDQSCSSEKNRRHPILMKQFLDEDFTTMVIIAFESPHGFEKFQGIWSLGRSAARGPGQPGRRRDTGPSRGTKNHPSASLFAVDIWSPPRTGKRKSRVCREQVETMVPRILGLLFRGVSRRRLTGPGHSLLLYDGERLSGCSGIGYTCFAITQRRGGFGASMIRPR